MISMGSYRCASARASGSLCKCFHCPKNCGILVDGRKCLGSLIQSYRKFASSLLRDVPQTGPDLTQLAGVLHVLQDGP